MVEVSADWEGLDEAFAALEAELTDVVRGLTVEVFWHTLKMSPQFYGRYASSWTYQIGTPDFHNNTTFATETREGFSVIRQKGDSGPIGAALSYSRGRDSAFKLGDTVYISNGVDHGEGPYAAGIEDGSIKLRSVNRPGMPLRRAIDMAGSWYGNEMKPTHVEPLKRVMRLY